MYFISLSLNVISICTTSLSILYLFNNYTQYCRISHQTVFSALEHIWLKAAIEITHLKCYEINLIIGLVDAVKQIACCPATIVIRVFKDLMVQGTQPLCKLLDINTKVIIHRKFTSCNPWVVSCISNNLFQRPIVIIIEQG